MLSKEVGKKMAENEKLVLRCKLCGAELDLSKAENGVVKCPYCRTQSAVPNSALSAKAIDMLSLGEHELNSCNFDAAYEAFKKAAAQDGKDPYAQYGMAIAKYRVQYLKDETTNPAVYRPICHRISSQAFSECGEYQRAIALANDEQKKVLRAQAREIDDIAEEFYNLQKSGKDYDVFISAKISDGNGGVTQESHEAMKLYNFLLKQGYKPFYSEQDLENLTGSDYEAHILYALTRAQSMLLVCFDEQYLETPWVKNEYVRFSELIKSGSKAKDALTVVFKNKPIETLPHVAGKVEGIDLAKPNAYAVAAEHVKRCLELAGDRKGGAKSATISAINREAELKKAENEARLIKLQEEKTALQLQKQNAKQDAKIKKMEQNKQRSAQRQQTAAARKQKNKEARSRAWEKVKKGAPEFFSVLGSVCAAPFIGIGRMFVDETAHMIVGIIVAILEAAGLLFMVSFPFAHPILNPSPEFTAYVAVGATLFAIMIFYFVFGFFCSPEGHISSVGITLAIEGALSVICFCIGWFTNNMHDWIWVFFAFGVVGVIIALCVTSNNYETDDGFSAIAACIMGFGALILVGGWLYTIQVGNDGFENGFYYDILEDGRVDIRVYDYNYEELTVPSEVADRDVNNFLGAVYGGGYELKRATISEGVQTIGDSAFAGCAGLTDIDIPDSLLYIDKNAFKNCGSLKSLVTGEELLSIGKSAFEGCTGLTEVNISDSSDLNYIGEYAFKNCGKLKAFNMNNNKIAKIEKETFKGCTSLAELNLSETLERIEDNAFENCISLLALVVPDKVTYIGYDSFKNCTSLAELTIGKSVTYICHSFTGCKNLYVFHFPEGSVWKRVPLFKKYDAFSWDSDAETIHYYVTEKDQPLERV